MKEMICNSAFFGVMISLSTYEIGIIIKKKFKWPLLNPLLISIALTIIILFLFDIDYIDYNEGAKYISYLLTPATVCLAIPLYEKIQLLKDNWKAITVGIAAGVLSSIGGVLAMSVLFGLTHEQYVTLLPKSITTAIGMGLSEELGGIVTITVAVIIITGIVGNVSAEILLKTFHIENPIARGIAIGTSSHALGTAKAFEIGEIEGAMSSLSIVVAGLLTVAMASVFANIY